MDMGNKHKNRCINWIHGHDSLQELCPTTYFFLHEENCMLLYDWKLSLNKLLQTTFTELYLLMLLLSFLHKLLLTTAWPDGVHFSLTLSVCSAGCSGKNSHKEQNTR